MQSLGASPVAQMVKNLPAVQETRLQSLWWEEPLEEEKATHSSILAWRILWTLEPGRLQSLGVTKSWTRWHTCSLWNKQTHKHFINAQGWDNGKPGGGKHRSVSYLGLPCTSSCQGSNSYFSPPSLNREKCFQVAWTKRRKHRKICVPLCTGRSAWCSDNHSVWWWLLRCHSFPNIPTRPIVKRPKSHISIQSSNCPLQMTHETGLPAICQRGWSKDDRFQPANRSWNSSWMFLIWVASS